MPKLTIPPNQTYPPTPEGGLPYEQYFRRGPYLYRQPSGIVELRIPSPWPEADAISLWKKHHMRWDKERDEWVRSTTRPLASLDATKRHYERFYPEYAEPRPIQMAPAAVGRVDFIVGNPDCIVVHEWPRGWGPRDPVSAHTRHERADFDLDAALDWCRRQGAEIITSYDGDYVRALFDGHRSIRTRGQILYKRRQNSLAQADFAYQ